MTAPIIASHLVVGADAGGAASEAARAVAVELGGTADLVVVFASPSLCADPAVVRAAIAAELAPRHMLGCMGAAVVGTGREVEHEPALVVWGAILPGARITPIRSVGCRDADGTIDVAGWPTAAGDDSAADPVPGDQDVVIALADPFSYPVEAFLRVANTSTWRPPVVGGLAAGGDRPGDHVLWLDDQYMHDGLVGVSIGGVNLTTAVSQGCTPIGPEMVVTDADGEGRIYALAGVPALTKLQEVLDGLDDAALEMVNTGITVGIVMNENKPEYQSGDYLMRGILGANADDGRHPRRRTCAHRPDRAIARSRQRLGIPGSAQRHPRCRGRGMAARSRARSCSPASCGDRRCSPMRTTTRRSSPRSSGTRPWPACFATASSVPSPDVTTCTDSLQRSRSLAASNTTKWLHPRRKCSYAGYAHIAPVNVLHHPCTENLNTGSCVHERH